MAGLTTHVLDVAQGRPAEGVTIDLYRVDGAGVRQRLCRRTTNSDGRCDQPLLTAEETRAGCYELIFHIGAYFAKSGLAVVDHPFLGEVPVRFSIADLDRHYHVPLLVAPWSYTTYRGS